MASTNADQFLELIAELDRVKNTTKVDEDHVKELEKKLIPYVEKNKAVIAEYRKDFQRLRMEKLLDMVTKIDIDNLLNKASSSHSKPSRDMIMKNK
ncbi:hypothetical protein ISN44_As13g001640 [Arabidopsis suecica]|uniref:Uncharacterized protein n=1 Tax=Arabidopsis suecica TaxID=45249 RepID=A0A8T1XYF1_ARASU|nr:hypothetical protein ISN44_As13g001640 [Arabidopsis suecica]